jgi:hypothetical protein
MVETLFIAGTAIVLFYWLKGAAGRSRQQRQQQRLNELLVSILQRARDVEVEGRPLERVEFVSLSQSDPVYDDLAEFFETPGRVPAGLHKSNYADLQEAIALWKEAAVRMNQRFGFWSHENQLRAEGRGERRPRPAVEAILDRMLRLGGLVDKERDWQKENERNKSWFDGLIHKLDSSADWTERALSSLKDVRMSVEDRSTVSRVRAWMAGGFTVLAARELRGALGPLVATHNASYVGEWLGEAGNATAINEAGFEVLSHGQKLEIGGETWDAVIISTGGKYVARLGKMGSPV